MGGGTGVYTTPFDSGDAGQHAAGTQHRQPGSAGRPGRRGEGAARSGHPARRAAARVPVRAAGRGSHPHPRRPGRPRGVQRDQRAVRGRQGVPGHRARLELRDGRPPRRQPAVRTRARSSPTRSPPIPSRPYYADQTRMYSSKNWVDMRFCTEEILRDRALRVTELGCVSDSGLRSARVRGARGGRVRLAFRRRVKLPVTVDVLRASPSRLRRVARVRRAKSFTLRRRLRAGRYVARFTALGRTGKADVREVAFTVRRRRVQLRAPRLLAPGHLRRAQVGHSGLPGLRRARRQAAAPAVPPGTSRAGVDHRAARRATGTPDTFGVPQGRRTSRDRALGAAAPGRVPGANSGARRQAAQRGNAGHTPAVATAS